MKGFSLSVAVPVLHGMLCTECNNLLVLSNNCYRNFQKLKALVYSSHTSLVGCGLLEDLVEVERIAWLRVQFPLASIKRGSSEPILPKLLASWLEAPKLVQDGSRGIELDSLLL